MKTVLFNQKFVEINETNQNTFTCLKKNITNVIRKQICKYFNDI